MCGRRTDLDDSAALLRPSRPHTSYFPRLAAVEVPMLTDWERRQLAEIERGLNEDFTLRRRAGRRFGSITPWAATGLFVFVACLLVLTALGAWHVAIALAAVCGLVALGRTTRRGRGGPGPRRTSGR
jgi:hypothetical protein